MWARDGQVKYLRRDSGVLHLRRRLQLTIDGRVQSTSGRFQDHRQRRGPERRDKAGGRPDCPRHRLRLHERLAGEPSLCRSGGPGGQVLAVRVGYSRGRGSCATCGSPPACPTLWIRGGNLHQGRHYSSYLALQLKARMEGPGTPVYEQPTHYTR